MSRAVLIVPERAGVPSGGTRYDLRMADVLRLRVVPVAGGWPMPSAADCAALDKTLAALPTGAVVLVDGLVACAVPEVIGPHSKRLRLGVLVHLPLPDETGLDPVVADTLARKEQQSLSAASLVVTTSAAAARLVRARYDLPEVRVAPPGVDRAPLTRAEPEGRRLVCVAAMTPRKGQDVLVEALGQLEDLSWHLRIAGPPVDARFAAIVQDRIERSGLADRIQLMGTVTGGRLDACYETADLLVLPSHAETFGMVVTEALARGVPVVAGDVGGVPEAVGAEPAGGVLVPPGDPAALARALRRWLTDAEHREELRRAAATRRRQLVTWTEAAKPLERALRDLATVAR
ncbi:glycosyltransferase family 4 protein [Thermocrispum municipale]|uniref:glycosyltransferase family 4 protein n=1 Tax=Thermocrispum municipale TaxID=37926 RepID=UPI00041013AA|nr:glycosyltransferase family 4 protein [Thermocrispum municipale]